MEPVNHAHRRIMKMFVILGFQQTLYRAVAIFIIYVNITRASYDFNEYLSYETPTHSAFVNSNRKYFAVEMSINILCQREQRSLQLSF